jgi:ferredoxin-NADP reductase
MYQLTLWGLRLLAVISIALSLTGALPLPTTGLLLSAVLLAVSSHVSNKILSRIWRAPANNESYAITLLILFFILPPVTSVSEGAFTAVAGVLAMASKYLLAYNAKHLFNPAAFAVVVLGVLGVLQATWWVGSAALWPLVLVLGLLILRKIRRFELFVAFAAVALSVLVLTAVTDGDSVADTIRFAITSSPLIFLGTIMLTEPATMPGRRRQQIIFGALVGLLYALPWNIGPLTLYPETALVIGNLYAFAVNPRYRLRLRLKEIQKVSDRVYNYVFTPDRKADFRPGQYMEWTLPHDKIDSRGNRRTFSIASSPTEPEIHLGVKYYTPPSSFKRALAAMQPGDEIMAGQIAGDFTLPSDAGQKLLIVAAGIGITPYRSMLKYATDTKAKRDMVLIYAVSDSAEVAYKDVLADAETHGIRAILLLTSGTSPAKSTSSGWKGLIGTLNSDFIEQQVPDYKDRVVYLSGPNTTVDNVRSGLLQSGMSRKRIKTDYFPGY